MCVPYEFGCVGGSWVAFDVVRYACSGRRFDGVFIRVKDFDIDLFGWWKAGTNCLYECRILCDL